MTISDNHHTYLALRNKYPQFVYEKFQIIQEKDLLTITHFFHISNTIHFEPSIEIPLKESYKKLNNEELEVLAFNHGMIELISYWKASCSPEVIIKPFSLNEEQISFWKKIYFNGLGEFFYLNNIDTNLEEFMHIIPDSVKTTKTISPSLGEGILIPVGGGKDSVVSLEILKKQSTNIQPLIMNPRGATIDSIKAAGFSMDDVFVIKRNIHPQLLELNKQGFLNGHTPFSACLAFITVIASLLSNKKYVALSNEASANESTIIGSDVNHQYSKSFDFEEDFRSYVDKYVCKDHHYFSFLRPLSELQIAMLFASYPHYHDVFKSCNVGSKTNIWCGNCPKCLFVWLILSPFIPQKRLKEIFGKDLANDKNLYTYFNELIGETEAKPFECVGTTNEVRLAVSQFIRKNKKGNLPYLFNYYQQNFSLTDEENWKNEMQQFSSPHSVEQNFLQLIKEELTSLNKKDA